MVTATHRDGRGHIHSARASGSSQAAEGAARQLSYRLGAGVPYEMAIRYDRRLDPALDLPSGQDCVDRMNVIMAQAEIGFEPSSSTIAGDAAPTLTQLADAASECGDYRIEVAGHTDSQGSENFNAELSRTRAQAVVAQIRERGGEAEAVVRPGSLLELWQVLQLCVKAGRIVIAQAANTGLTEGSTPKGTYDRPVVIVNTLRLSRIDPILDGAQVLQQVRLAPHDELAGLGRADAHGEPSIDQPLGERVELPLHVAPPGLDLGAQLAEGPTLEAGVEVVRGFLKGARRQAGGKLQKPVLHRAVVGDEDHEGARHVEAHELDVLEVDVRLRRQHHARPAGDAREQGGRLRQRRVEGVPRGGGAHLRLDMRLLLAADVADLHHRVDEEAQADLGGQPPG